MTSEALVEQASTLEGQPCPHCQQDGHVQAEVVRNWLDGKAVRIIAFCSDCGRSIDPDATVTVDVQVQVDVSSDGSTVTLNPTLDDGD
jgi:uncharacterized Zn finger protein